MTLQKGWLVRAVVLFAGVLLLSVQAAAGGVTISKCVMTDKTHNTEVTEGYAQDVLSVEFKSQARCSCETPSLTYTWFFGDGDSATGQTVSHAYAGAKAGNRSASLRVRCSTCGSIATRSGLSVHAISGIKVTKIGDIENPTDNGRLCFDGERTVTAEALPPGVSGSNLIDAYVTVGTCSTYSKNCDGMRPLATFPRYNFAWGAHTLYISIDGPHVPDQQGELNLTGTVSYIANDKAIKVFYDGTGDQNPTADPNWFCYYKDNAGGGVYTYQAGDSSATAGGGMASVRIGDTAYTGNGTIVFDYGNPGDRLRATGWHYDAHWYAYFCGALAHESQHALNETTAPNTDGDTDGDWLRSAFETGTSRTDPSDPNSASGPTGFTDDEVYAGGPVEQAGIDGADTSNDWAHPGTNWH